MRALKIAATGMLAQQMNVEVISNNIANLNTTSFKKARAEFSDLFYQTVKRQGAFSSDAGNIVPVGVQLGLGVKPASVSKISTQGNLQATGNRFDLAIEGQGFFEIIKPNGDIAFTRAGTFRLSPEGQLVTVDGYQVNPGVFINQEAIDVTINAQGEIFEFLPGDDAPVSAGVLTLVNFINEAGLEAIGDNMYLETPASGQPQEGLAGQQGFGTIRQGFVETSNVDIVEEITNLITAQRAYEMNAKVIETGDQMASTVNNIR